MLQKKEENKDYKEGPSKYNFWMPGTAGVIVKDVANSFELVFDSDYSWEMVGMKKPIKYPRKVLSIKKGDI